MKRLVVLLAFLLVMGTLPGTATASPFVLMVGDNDGYGFGVPDNGTATWPCYICWDGRSPAEVAATNGAQYTDVYATLFPGAGPIGVTVGDIIFPFTGTLTSASVTVDMADFQIPDYMKVYFNGILQPGLFAFSDGFEVTKIRTFALDGAALAAANLAGQFVMRLDGSNVSDYVAFDYFELRGETAAVPDAGSSLLLLGMGFAGLRAWKKMLG